MSAGPTLCRSCGALCIWAESEATATKPGKPLLLDADPDNGRAKVFANGNLIIVPGTRTPRGSPIVRYVTPGTGMHQAHFASCPDGGKWRKK